MRIDQFVCPSGRLQCECGAVVRSWDLFQERDRATVICAGCHRDLINITFKPDHEAPHENAAQ